MSFQLTGIVRTEGSGFVDHWLTGSVEEFARLGIEIPAHRGQPYEDYRMTVFKSGVIHWAGLYYVNYVACEPETSMAPNSKEVLARRRMGSEVPVHFID